MTVPLTHAEILRVRDASRRMVRHLGFMRPTLAETDLSASAVHAIIEIGSHAGLTANRLGQVLLLEKSSISRLVARLVERGLVAETTSASDGRAKNLALTADGQALLADIDHYANHQVGRALLAMNGDARAQVVGGLAAYAQALKAVGGGTDAGADRQEVEIRTGFRPGALGRIAEMHGLYYSRVWGFPQVFEAKVAAGLADFVPRLDRPGNQLWLALQGERICGSAAIDGEDLADGRAHLRWVIVDDALQGAGVGRRLLTEAVAFCDAQKFAEIHLWTFRGLDAARRLYESFGFALVEEWTGTQWGFELPEQRFVRRIG
jgi:DNA-binding MarR family transcriptional regulator/GNAT superfamily N-acetyltransferase